MLAVLPLTIHPEPQRVLLLGDATGACLRTCSGFPLLSIVAVRPSAESTDVAGDVTWKRLQRSPAEDDRVTLRVGSAPATIRGGEPHAFDVIISNSGDAATAAGAAEFTQEYYQAARRRLDPGGVFCQRFRQPDFGPRPLEHVLATLAQTFTHAIAVQTIPGEGVLLASDKADGLIDDRLLTRLQRHHVRREIATAGWDW